MSETDLLRDPQAMDVSGPETHYQVQCAEVRLLKSMLQPIENHDETDVSRILFKIEITVEQRTAFTHLHVQVAALSDTPELPGSILNFTLQGVFRSEGEMPQESLADFARFYSLSILWPYAREYTADQLRRAGLPYDSLPIINPQVITEKLIDADLVKLEILREGERYFGI